MELEEEKKLQQRFDLLMEEMMKLRSQLGEREGGNERLSGEAEEKEGYRAGAFAGEEPYGEKERKNRLIGLAGSKKGAGVTHTAIVLANFLKRSEEGITVAILECNPSGDFERIGESYGILEEGGFFTCEGIDYYCHADPKRLDLALRMEYDYMLLDMGLYGGCDREVFHTCDEQLVVAGGKPWETEAVTDVFAAAGGNTAACFFCFNLVPETLMEVVREGMGELKTVFLSYTEDPFVSAEPFLSGTVFPELSGERRAVSGKKKKKAFWERRR